MPLSEFSFFSGPLRRGVIIATVLAIAAVIMLFLSASYAAFTKFSKIKKGKHSENEIIIVHQQDILANYCVLTF